MYNKKVVWRIVSAFLICLVFAALISATTTIKQGEVGVVTRFGRATGREMGPGFNWKIPFAEGVTKMDVRIKKAEAKAGAGTRDLQIVNTQVVLNYHILAEDASDIFSDIGDDDMLYDRVIYPAIQEVVKAAFAQYRAEELLTKRDEVKADVDLRLTERLDDYYVRINDVSLTDINFSEEFDTAIEAKQVAEQLAQKAKYEVETAKAEAEKNQAQTKALTPEILQKMWIEKWDGKLPQVVSDDGTFLYNLGSQK